MNKILYYPYINLPKTDWTLRTLLYYDNVGSIVPQEYFYFPERKYEPFMLELVRNGLVIPINPIEVLIEPWKFADPLLSFLQSPAFQLEQKQINFQFGSYSIVHMDKFKGIRIHADKFDGEVFYNLVQLGLAKRQNDSWYIVENSTAGYLMKFLATLISSKLEMLPTTDSYRKIFSRQSEKRELSKRETILESLIPFPENIDYDKLQVFKKKHEALIKLFRNKVEQLVLDATLLEGTKEFDLKLEELISHKDELTVKMKENNLGGIIFGTVCGIIGAVQGISTAQTTGAVIGGLPGFASAVYSALKIEKAEHTFDQSGMKYLALLDKRLGQR